MYGTGALVVQLPYCHTSSEPTRLGPRALQSCYTHTHTHTHTHTRLSFRNWDPRLQRPAASASYILAIGSGQRILYRLGSGLWIVPVLVLWWSQFLNDSPHTHICSTYTQTYRAGDTLRIGDAKYKIVKLKLTLTLVLTLTDTGSAVLTLMLGYRSFIHYRNTLVKSDCVKLSLCPLLSILPQSCLMLYPSPHLLASGIGHA